MNEPPRSEEVTKLIVEADRETQNNIATVECGEIDSGTGEPTDPKHCLTPSDAPGHVFKLRFPDGGNNGYPVEIDVIGSEGETHQTISELADNFAFPSQLMDLNDDGVDELLVSLGTGTVNTVYAVWERSDSNVTYVRAGEIHGYGIDPWTGGLFKASARSTAATYEHMYQRLVDGRFESVVSAFEDYSSGSKTCTISDEGGLAALGLSDAEAKEQFCPKED